MAEEILRLEKVCKAYNVGQPVRDRGAARHRPELEHGEFLALMGPSGSGKSTLSISSDCSTGRLPAGCIKGEDTGPLGDAEITHLRGHTIGFVFQYHHPDLGVHRASRTS